MAAAANLNFGQRAFFDTTVAFYNGYAIPINFGYDWSISKVMAVFEIQDGGGSHLEKYSSGGAASIRNESFGTSDQKPNFFGVNLTFSLLLGALMLKQFPQQIGSPKTGRNLVFFGPQAA